jgi:DNA-binding transcriptional LysR family regulator
VLVGHLPSSSLIARQVGHVRSMVCSSPAYLACHGEPNVPQDLSNHRLVATHAYRDKVQWDFHQDGEFSHIKARTRISCATIQAAIDAAAHGAGITRCPSYPLHEYLSTGRLVRVLQRYELPALPVNVVYREGRKASMRVRSFVDHIVDGLREHPAMQLDAS